MKNILSNTSTSTRMLSLVGAFMLALNMMTANTYANESSDQERPKHCKKHKSGKHHGKDLSYILKKLDRKLELSDEQKTSISKVIEQYNPEIKELHNQMREGRKAGMELTKQDSFDEAAVRKQAEQNAKLMVEMKVLKSKAKHEIHSYLTDEQKSKLKEMFEKRRKDKGEDKA